MKVCFFGMGSIGKQHARNLRSVLRRRGKSVEIHALRSRRGEAGDDPPDKNLFSWDELEPPYDAVFITNPTSLHYETLLRAEPLGRAFFLEKPLFHTSAIDEKSIAPFAGRTVHVACPLRFHTIIQHLKERMPGRVMAARLLCSSYLPEWRKGRDYRTIYSARRGQGGGAAMDLIHELDYARHLFGNPGEVVRVCGRFSRLEIDAEDAAAYILSYSEKLVEIHLDYFGRKSRREMDLFCEEETFVCDLLGGTMTALISGEVESFPQEDIHEKEMEYFVSLLELGEQSFNPPEYALGTLRMAEGRRVR